jgi:uroporphyrin-III C-methyltransferase/precorrin-2 dehydrogenase/sirohydrochlorin ferrochelatase
MREDGRVSPYLAGLQLAGRTVVVVGAGRVAARRLPLLLSAGAAVTVVAPEATPAVARMALRGEVIWEQRGYRRGALTGAWYVLVATDDRSVNAAASAEAEGNRTFCVRADDASEATAWTPATAEVDGALVGVLTGGDPRHSVQLRDLVVEVLRRLRRRAA